MMQMKCKETTQYPECPVVNLQQSRDSDLLSVTTPHAPEKAGECLREGVHPQEPSVQPSSRCGAAPRKGSGPALLPAHHLLNAETTGTR